MTVNLYDKVYFASPGERSLGEQAARKLVQWGDRLIATSIREQHDGHNYKVSENGFITDLPASFYFHEEEEISTFQKIKAFVGLHVKEVAMFFCKKIEQDYRAARAGDIDYFKAPFSAKPVFQSEGRGQNGAQACMLCCVGCCQFCAAICEIINKH